uniref:Solute carrier family 12 member 9 n=1 Tax=Sander lucioperca TaxID=283035 RepID=A0A8C9ZQM9_SANLU
MSEKSALLHYRLAPSTSPWSKDVSKHSGIKAGRHGRRTRDKTARELGVVFGVVIPTVLSMFSVVLFLRIGFVVGQAGLYQSIAMFLVAYFIITMTVLSVCAISTNGALDAGGAYYMISRALGPEFGGSIGIMFFFANVCGSALYVLGLVEAIMSTFGIPEDGAAGLHQVLPSGYWWSLLYGTVLLFLCFIVCLVRLHCFHFTLCFTVFTIVFRGCNKMALHGLITLCVELSVLATELSNYTVDYTTGAMMNFATVFAVMFNGCTGIMAGSNMSGKMVYSIPRGTLAAVLTTFITYNLLSLLVALSCDRHLLQKDYSFLGDINIWKPLVTIGVYSSTLSAAMSNLIGASRVLYALSKDNLFGKIFEHVSYLKRGNPWAAVLVSWLLIQVVLFAGKLNTIAGIVTIFFLLVYAAVNLACLALEWASAPNFRPSFRCFTWHTCTLGILGCLVMMFLINAIYAFASIAFMLLLLMLIHYLGPISNWGYISQALIYHQYLLMLDGRKDHVKFWRSQLMVANPHSCTGLMTFINDLKKSGLYVLGHVKLGSLDGLPSDPLQSHYDSWLSLVDHLNIKAFVNLTLADSVRHRVQNLLFVTGFGGMRPNTLVLGFYDDCTPQDHLQGKILLSSGCCLDTETPSIDPREQWSPFFHNVRDAEELKDLQEEEYVSVIADAVKMGKNVTLARYFNHMTGQFIDVWLLNLLRPDGCGYVDICSLFLLQLASVLKETRAWSQARLRLFLCVEAGCSLKEEEEEKKLRMMLKELRISAQVQIVAWDPVVAALHRRDRPEDEKAEKEDDIQTFPNNVPQLTDEYICAVNDLIRRHGAPQPAVRFLYLPRPPADTSHYHAYLHQVAVLSWDLGPTLLIHGVTPVVTTDL